MCMKLMRPAKRKKVYENLRSGGVAEGSCYKHFNLNNPHR
jgi:hypothetical protein